MYETVSIETDSRGVATLWLDREEKHNALSAQMIAELHDAAETLGQDDDVRVVVLAAKGKSFCAGGDLGWMREQFEAEPGVRSAEATKLAMMLQALNTMPKPLIGKVHGNAFGGGLKREPSDATERGGAGRVGAGAGARGVPMPGCGALMGELAARQQKAKELPKGSMEFR